MPSGITHMMISRKALDRITEQKNGDVHALLQSYRGPFIAGCVAPDLPYMTLTDLNPFSSRKVIADSMHYSNTNQVPLLGLKEARDFAQSGQKEKAEALFSFYIGYCSHL